MIIGGSTFYFDFLTILKPWAGSGFGDKRVPSGNSLINICR